MKLLLQRNPSFRGATIGTLTIDGEFECYTLEDEIREPKPPELPQLPPPVAKWKIPGITAIPMGTYQVIIDRSIRFNRPMLHVLNVPGFSGIRIHAGNTNKDTKGCILVGQEKGQAVVLRSTLALDDLYGKVLGALGRGEKVELEIVGPYADTIPPSAV